MRSRRRRAPCAPCAAVPHTRCRLKNTSHGNRSRSRSTRPKWAAAEDIHRGAMNRYPVTLAATRRHMLKGAGALALAAGTVGLAGRAEALVEIDITRGNVQPLPIAITTFIG